MAGIVTPARLRTLIFVLIFVGGVIVGFFGLRTLRAFREFRGHPPAPASAAERIELDVGLIRDWMTIPFISKMYRIPSDVLFDALEIPAKGNREKSLKQLNEEYFPQAVGIVLGKVRAAVLAELANQPRHTENEVPVVTLTPTAPAVP